MELLGVIGEYGVMPPEQTDAEVIAASLTEPAAFGAIFDRHYAAVHRFAERRVGPDQAAEVASETLVRAFARRTAFPPEAVDARPWLFGIASNLILHEQAAEVLGIPVGTVRSRLHRAKARLRELLEPSGRAVGDR